MLFGSQSAAKVCHPDISPGRSISDPTAICVPLWEWTWKSSWSLYQASKISTSKLLFALVAPERKKAGQICVELGVIAGSLTRATKKPYLTSALLEIMHVSKGRVAAFGLS